MIVKLARGTLRWTLIVITVFNALSAVAGGIAILATNGLGMPLSMLKNGPFNSFTAPGIILLVVVGGSQVVSGVLLLMRKESAYVWTSIAGFGIVIWIFVEVAIIEATAWLQVLYFSTGLAQLIAVVVLLGVVHWLPRIPLSGVPREGDRAPQAR